MTDKPVPALLALEDGFIARGTAIGRIGTAGGEVCFNTSMTGYQEIFTDPSYHGQLMTMTYPHIGNYGTSYRDDEASRVMIAGLIVRSFSPEYSNPGADRGLQAYLEANDVVGITGVDTRQLVRHIRTKGVMNAVISSDHTDPDMLVKMAADWPRMVGLELATKVSRREAQTLPATSGEARFRVAVMDYGVKQSILRNLASRGCALRVFPATSTADEVAEWAPDGLFLSNGPGDPNATFPHAAPILELAKRNGWPVFGICLGHQLMALSEGIGVGKMFVGHRGANQPVMNLDTRLVEITTQNHGFAVQEEQIDEAAARITHVNLNDRTIEGLRFKTFTGFSVQYHPEASPGPHDSAYLFDTFIQDLEHAAATS